VTKDSAVIGVSDHGGWAILVTVASDGTVLDRRRVELVDDALPALPHHHEGQMMPVEDAVALVARVRASAEKHARLALDALAAEVPQLTAIALRERQPLPATVAERITNVRARNVADWVMYREALAKAAEERGLRVHWYDPKALTPATFDALRKKIGPPWNNDHKLAMAAAASALTEIPPMTFAATEKRGGKRT
jgi:hypothetical protein